MRREKISHCHTLRLVSRQNRNFESKPKNLDVQDSLILSPTIVIRKERIGILREWKREKMMEREISEFGFVRKRELWESVDGCVCVRERESGILSSSFGAIFISRVSLSVFLFLSLSMTLNLSLFRCAYFCTILSRYYWSSPLLFYSFARFLFLKSLDHFIFLILQMNWIQSIDRSTVQVKLFSVTTEPLIILTLKFFSTVDNIFLGPR